jgi:hypothetical protein
VVEESSEKVEEAEEETAQKEGSFAGRAGQENRAHPERAFQLHAGQKIVEVDD